MGTLVMSRYANYRGDATHLVGETVEAPYLLRSGGAVYRTWVVTDAVYDFQRDSTRVEFDLLRSD